MKRGMGNQERLQKVIASTGLASRRRSEELILEGAVTVNGKLITTLGTKVDPQKDAIKVNGKLIMASAVDLVYIAFYKPMGVLSAFEDTEGRPHMADYLRRVGPRVHPVGRLNFTSEGLLLLTNDGEWLDTINRSRHLTRTYRLKVKGHHGAADLVKFKRGIFTQEGVIRFKKVELEEELRAKSWLALEVIEGAQLDLRETLNHRGFRVDRIIRTGIGSLTAEELTAGQWRELTKKEVESLRQEAQEAAKGRPAFKAATIVVKTKTTSSRGAMYTKDQRDTRRMPRGKNRSEDGDSGFSSSRSATGRGRSSRDRDDDRGFERSPRAGRPSYRDRNDGGARDNHGGQREQRVTRGRREEYEPRGPRVSRAHSEEYVPRGPRVSRARSEEYEPREQRGPRASGAKRTRSEPRAFDSESPRAARAGFGKRPGSGQKSTRFGSSRPGTSRGPSKGPARGRAPRSRS